MRIFLPIFIGLSVVLLNTAGAQTRLKTAATAQVEAGYITQTVVLADEKGELFLELLKGDRVAKSLDNQIYDGEILPPVQIDTPAKAPRARMREILSFEVFSDTNEPIDLIDQYSALHAKKRLRLSLASSNKQRQQGAQLITTFNAQQNLGKPALWRYLPERAGNPWQRLGGISRNAQEEDLNVFSAFLYASGVYTIWDENPLPDFEVAFPIDQIQPAEISPFPSVTEETEIGFDENEFVEELLGDETLFTETTADSTATTPLPEDFSDSPLIPAVPLPTPQPTTTENQPPITPLTPNLNPVSDLLAIPPQQASPSTPLKQLLQLPENPPTNNLGQNLQSNSFKDFGVTEGDLPEAGSFKFPWAILLVFGVIGFSLYTLRKKTY